MNIQIVGEKQVESFFLRCCGWNNLEQSQEGGSSEEMLNQGGSVGVTPGDATDTPGTSVWEKEMWRAEWNLLHGVYRILGFLSSLGQVN